MACGSGVASTDAVPRAAGPVAGGAASVLDVDRYWYHYRGGCGAGGGVSAGGNQVVRPCWWDETFEPR